MAVVPDRPWENLIYHYTAVLKVSDSDYRTYYTAFGSHTARLSLNLWGTPTCTAFSSSVGRPRRP